MYIVHYIRQYIFCSIIYSFPLCIPIYIYTHTHHYNIFPLYPQHLTAIFWWYTGTITTDHYIHCIYPHSIFIVSPLYLHHIFGVFFWLIHLWSNSEKSQKSGIHPKAWLGGRGLRQMLGRFAWGKRFMVLLPAPMVLSRSQKYISVWKNQCLCCVFQTAYVYLPKRSKIWGRWADVAGVSQQNAHPDIGGVHGVSGRGARTCGVHWPPRPSGGGAGSFYAVSWRMTIVTLWKLEHLQMIYSGVAIKMG